MGSTSANRGFILPSVAGDPGVWGSELNQTIAALDATLGTQSTFPSSTYGTNITVASSQAQVCRLAVTSAGAGPFTLTLPASNYAKGIFAVSNGTLGPLTVRATSSGNSCVVPSSINQLVFADGVNVVLAHQQLAGTAAAENIATGAQFLAGTTGLVVDTTTVANAAAQTALPNLAGATYSLDLMTFIFGTATITANTTLLLTNNGANLGALAGQWRNLILYQDGAGAHTLTAGTGFALDNGGSAIPIATNAGVGTHISFFIRGASYVEIMIAARNI